MNRKKSGVRSSFDDSGIGSFGSDNEGSPHENYHPVFQNMGEISELSDTCQKLDLDEKDAPIEYPAYTVTYIGSYLLDRKYTQSMLPWVIAGIRRKPSQDRIVTLEVLAETLRGSIYTPNGIETLFDHNLNHLFRFTQIPQDKSFFAYLSRENIRAQFSCHVFQAPDETQVSLFFISLDNLEVNGTDTRFFRF